MPEADSEAGCKLAERLRRTIEQEEIDYANQRLRMTMSFGVAAIGAGVESPDILLRKADEALYKAKKAGRNRVVSA